MPYKSWVSGQRWEKRRKSWKKCLTKLEESSIIYKLSARRLPQKGSRQASEKVFKKLLKKGLTNSHESGIITRSPQKRRQRWSLKIEQQERSTKHISMCETDLEQFFEWEYYSKTKVKEAKSKTRKQIGSTRRNPSRFNTMISRVWSWLRMNAGGVHNTFKSNGLIRKLASDESQWRTGE